MSDTLQRQTLSDTETLRRQAQEHPERGALTEGYGADRAKVIELLNTALATELVCILRYRRHYHTATGLAAEAVAQEFLVHANEEQQHADQLAERIVQLGGQPDFSPDSLTARSHAEYDDSTDLREMLRVNLVAERIAVQAYSELVRYIDNDDPTTRRMLEGILAQEEEHADDMAGFLEREGS